MTIAFCFPAILLKSVDLPTLGLPTMAITGFACISNYVLIFFVIAQLDWAIQCCFFLDSPVKLGNDSF
jgi:hypothetical protein